MTWNQDPEAVAINALDFYWDPMTWLFPLVLLIPLALGVDRSNMVASVGYTEISYPTGS